MRLHFIAGLLAVLLIPAASRLFGSGRLSWTMYSRIEPYRLRITGVTAHGKAIAVSPTSVAALARGHVASYLAGAEAWRPISAGNLLRDHLHEIAALACRSGPFVTVETELLVRRDAHAPDESTTVQVPCDR